MADTSLVVHRDFKQYRAKHWIQQLYVYLFWSYEAVFMGAHQGLKLAPAHPLNTVKN